MKSIVYLTAYAQSMFVCLNRDKYVAHRFNNSRIHRFSQLICFSFLIFFSACQKEIHFDKQEVVVGLVNPGFENGLTGWQIETDYRGQYGFSSSEDAVRNGKYGLNFYASQSDHFVDAPQETPWNGLIYQTITGLKDGNYTFKAYADAVGEGMYLWASSADQVFKVPIKSDKNEVNTLDFVVKGGTAKVGFICINADGDEYLAPYFHADDVELWSR